MRSYVGKGSDHIATRSDLLRRYPRFAAWYNAMGNRICVLEWEAITRGFNIECFTSATIGRIYPRRCFAIGHRTHNVVVYITTEARAMRVALSNYVLYIDGFLLF